VNGHWTLSGKSMFGFVEGNQAEITDTRSKMEHPEYLVQVFINNICAFKPIACQIRTFSLLGKSFQLPFICEIY
jgi:hypothetical protein